MTVESYVHVWSFVALPDCQGLRRVLIYDPAYVNVPIDALLGAPGTVAAAEADPFLVMSTEL